MSRAFLTEFIRSISHGAGRFVAIAVIAALGAGFYAGLRMTAPDMKQAVDIYFDATNMHDLRVVSSIGWDDEAVDRIADIEGVEAVMPVHEADAVIGVDERPYVARVTGLDVDAAEASDTTGGVRALSDDASYLDRPILVEGSWPASPNECVLAESATLDSEPHIGDTIRVTGAAKDVDDVFSETEYTVTGFVRSPSYVYTGAFGSSSLGRGLVDEYLYVPDGAFAEGLPYADVRVSVEGARDLDACSDTYDRTVDEVAHRIEEDADGIAEARLERFRAKAQADIDAARDTLEDEEYRSKSLANTLAFMLENRDEGAAGLEARRAEGERELAEAREAIDRSQADLDAMAAPDVYVLDRSKNTGAASFTSDADHVDHIAQVFPLMFFLVAALVSLTTMTRMVEDERGYVGTLKALGYAQSAIASKYLVYAVLAAGVGSAVGIAALGRFLPWFIMKAYAVVYDMPVMPTPIDPGIALLSGVLCVGITLAATGLVVRSTLVETPAALMLPRAPRAGKRILIERIPPLWRRMSFLWKVTARNIFRCKRRFLMACAGIAGCTALLLTGFGLHDSINDIIAKEFGPISHYQTTITVDEDISDESSERLEALLDDADVFTSHTAAHTETLITKTSDGADHRVSLVVPQDVDEFESEYLTLRERVGARPLPLGDGSAILGEKLASTLGVRAGDTVRLFEEDETGNAVGDGFDVTVGGASEGYVWLPAYMSPAYYREVFGKDPAFTTIYAQEADASGEALREASAAIQAIDGVNTVGSIDDTIEYYETALQSVNAVVVVLIVAAALLAFVVIYNLTNINIEERMREVATLKVLGFTPHEVNAYIYRETLIIAAIGSAVGLALGIWLEGFVVATAEVDAVMFGRDIHAASFVLAFVLTMAFAGIVSAFMKRKLDGIDMVESLKSVE